MKYLLFSDFIKRGLNFFGFYLVVAWRWVYLSLRGKTEIKCLEISQSKHYVGRPGYLICDFYFENALWYEFEDGKKTTKQGPHLISQEKFCHGLKFKVVGIKETLVYDLPPVFASFFIKDNYFNTRISNKLNPVTLFNPGIMISFREDGDLHFTRPFELNHQKIKVKAEKLKINHTTYNQNQFL